MEDLYFWAPYLIGAVPVIVVAGWGLRRLRRKEPPAAGTRPGKRFSTDDDGTDPYQE